MAIRFSLRQLFVVTTFVALATAAICFVLNSGWGLYFLPQFALYAASGALVGTVIGAFFHRKLAGAVIVGAAALGIPVGWFAVVSGGHGGSMWPTIVCSGPAWILGDLICGDTPSIMYFMMGGTAVTYAIYAFVLTVVQKLWATLCVSAFHFACGAYIVWTIWRWNPAILSS